MKEVAKNIWHSSERINIRLLNLAQQQITHEQGDDLMDALSSKQFRMVRAVKELSSNMYPEGSSLKELARYQGISEPSASVMVNTLVKKGVLIRHIPESDRRAVKIQLAEEVTKHFEAIDQALYRNIAAIAETCGNELLLQWQHILQQVSQILDTTAD